jgi:excisionase family DNA binding protein
VEKSLSADWAYASVPQLASHLRVAQLKILRWIANGDLRAANVGTNTRSRPVYRIARVDFNAFWASRTTSPPVPPAPRRGARKSATQQFV